MSAAPGTGGTRLRRVLCYNPYNKWDIHSRWELTLVKAMLNAGTEVRYLACDSLYDECDLHSLASPRKPNACPGCMRHVTGVLDDMGIPYEWLGRWVSPEIFADARRWAESLSPGEMEDAEHQGAPIGAWVRSSVHTYFRRSSLALDDPEVIPVYRKYLYSGAVAHDGLRRAFRHYRPEVALLFNGRLSSLRIAFEIARQEGVPVVCHERGMIQDTIFLDRDENCLSIERYRNIWEEWKSTPLLKKEIRIVEGWLKDRRVGRKMSWQNFSPSPGFRRTFFRRVGLDPKLPIFALFTSCDDEYASAEQWKEIFPRQLDWVERSVDYFRDRPDLQLVIRVHPVTGGKIGLSGTNHQQLEGLKDVGRRLPPNARMVMPGDPVSTYSLMDSARAGIVYFSTTGLEMAALGKPVLAAARSHYHGMPFVLSLEDQTEYPRFLDRLIEMEPSQETARLAYRFLYHSIIASGIPFPLVTETAFGIGRLNYTDPSKLHPKMDSGLERIMGCILDGAPVYPPPGEAERARSPADEDAYFGSRKRWSAR